MWFADRQEAGRLLARRLLSLKQHHPAILVVPPGGVPVGQEVARALEAPLELALAEAIAAPGHSGRVIGAVVDGSEPQLVIDGGAVRQLDLPLHGLAAAADAAQAELNRRRGFYVRCRPPLNPYGRVLIIVDDGIATADLIRAILRGIRPSQPARILVAAPVGLRSAVETLRVEADDVICLGTPDDFVSVAQYYRQFPRLSDADAAGMLAATQR